MEKNYDCKKEVKLSSLKVGQKGKIKGIFIENKALKRRLLDMGITKNVVITIKRISPLGDPINIELRGYELSIRKDDMDKIECEVIIWDAR